MRADQLGVTDRDRQKFVDNCRSRGGRSTRRINGHASGSLPSAHASQRRDYHRHWTPVHLDFVVDDVWAAVQRALNAGAKLEGEVQCHPWGYLGTMSDPFGHGFCLLQFIGSGYDEVESTAS